VLRTPDWHGWYGVPKYIKDWECTDEKWVSTATFGLSYWSDLSYLGFALSVFTIANKVH
jgi:hypothetical protein